MLEVSDQIDALSKRLLNGAKRDPHLHWQGYLSSSALSSALAVLALMVIGRRDDHSCIISGINYLCEQQLEDGSWGDTYNSPGNISTSVLCWASLKYAQQQVFEHQNVESLNKRIEQSIYAAEQYIESLVTSLDANDIAHYIQKRYGKDKTFAVPILMAASIAGCLGPEEQAWKHVQQLPFELAIFPQSMYAMLKLPVVSYALPALIAIGSLRHLKRPTWFHPLRLFRSCVLQRCLRKLESLQPTNGGFLEATPLTAFVAMALSHAGFTSSHVCKRARAFLLNSQRDDGSWPIDTNLSTWVTSLAIHALPKEHLQAERDGIIAWYEDQQFKERHPYTGALPGAWAWSPLPGAVPDADDTSAALLALHKMSYENITVVEAALHWLLQLQNSDGGMPTFCKGWGTLPFDQSCADISAHALRVMLTWQDHCSSNCATSLHKAVKKLQEYIQSVQLEDGSFLPLWFGNQDAPGMCNPVLGTARVLLAIAGVEAMRPVCLRSVSYLLQAQNADGSWGAASSVEGSVEETALAVEALSSVNDKDIEDIDSFNAALDHAARYLQAVEYDTYEARPIGLYFANLWYYEKYYPLCFALAALCAYAKRGENICELT